MALPKAQSLFNNPAKPVPLSSPPYRACPDVGVVQAGELS